MPLGPSSMEPEPDGSFEQQQYSESSLSPTSPMGRRLTDGSTPSLQERRRGLQEQRQGSKGSCTSSAVGSLFLDCKSVVAARAVDAGVLLAKRYETLYKLGQGSFASVHKARRLADGEDVSLKIKRSDDAEIVATMKREYDILMQLQHPYVIRALDFLLCPRQGCVLVLEYVEDAHTLGDAVAAAPGHVLGDAVACRLMRCLLEAVAYVHRCGIVHRDVKAEHVLVVGNPVAVDLHDLRLLDFNVAKRTSESQCLTMTGTPEYMPPEVLMGNPHSDLSDSWAAGICLYYMLVGDLPLQRCSYKSDEDLGSALRGFSGDASENLEQLAARRGFESFSVQAHLLLGGLLEVDPARRLPAAMAIERAFGRPTFVGS